MPHVFILYLGVDHLIFDGGVVQIPKKISSTCFWLKKNFLHWQFFQHLLKHSCQSQMKLRVSKTFLARENSFPSSQWRDYKTISHTCHLCSGYVQCERPTITVRNNNDKTPQNSIIRLFFSLPIRLANISNYCL